MKRFVKIGLAIIGIIIVLIVIAAIVLPLVINPNDFKPQIEAMVHEQTGRNLSIAGDINLSVFPWLHLQVGKASLSNAPGFGEQPFAQIKSAQVSVKVWPLLSKHIEVGTVELDGLRLHLARHADGKTNWDDLVKATSNEKTHAQAQTEPVMKTSSGFAMPQFKIRAIKIADAAASWDDATTNAHYKISNLHVSTGTLTPDKPVSVDAGFKVDAKGSLDMTAKANLSATVSADLNKQLFRISDLVVDATASGKNVPGGAQSARITGRAQANLQTGQFSADNLVLKAAGITAKTDIKGSGLNASPKFSGQLSVQPFAPRAVMKKLAMTPPETTDSSVLSSVSLSTDFAGSPASASLKDIVIKLDNSTLRGHASVSDFAHPAIGFDLSMDQIDVDRYRPPSDSSGQSDQASAQTPAQATSGEIDLAPLKALDMDGRVTIHKLTAANLKIRDARLAVTAHNGKLVVRPLSANLYNGSLKMQTEVNASGKRPVYHVKGDMDALKFGPLLKDLIGSDKVDGLINLSLDLTTAGKTVKQMRRALDGSVSLQVSNGSFSGFDLAKILQYARQRFLGHGDNSQAKKTAGETPFSQFRATLSVADGLFSGHNSLLSSQSLSADGHGKYNLVANELDYMIDAKVPASASGALKNLKGLTIPIKLSGSLLSPDYSVDFAAALKAVANKRIDEEKDKLKQKADKKKRELQDKLDKKKQKLNNKLQNKLQQGLQDLFGK